MRFSAIMTAIVGVILLILTAMTAFTVDEGERAITLRNGAVTGVADPGLHFQVPVVDSFVRISLQNKARTYENLMAYSRDQQTATMRISVNYRLPADQLEEIYSQYGNEENLAVRLLDKRIYEDVKTAFGQFTAEKSITERARLSQAVQELVMKNVKGPILIESVQIENIDFSDLYEQSIEQRMLAEVEVQKVRQNAEREKVSAEIFLTKAKAEADATLARAEAEAKAVILRGEAEAKAIDARGKALRDNPALVELVAAERWDGVLPTQMIPQSTVPFINLGN